MMWGPSRHLGSLTAANWVSFDFNVSYSSCKGYSLINTIESLKKNYDGTKSKGERTKNNGSKKNAHRGQSVQYRSLSKRGNIKMAVIEDHASCWIHKDLTVTTKQIQALLTAARASGGKDEAQIRLTGISGNTGWAQRPADY